MWSGKGNAGNASASAIEAAQADLAKFVQDHKAQLYSGNGMAADVIDARRGYAELNQKLVQLRIQAEREG